MGDVVGVVCGVVLVVASPVGFVRHWRGRGRHVSVRRHGGLSLSFWARRGLRRITLVAGLAFLPVLLSGLAVYGLEELGEPLPGRAAAWVVGGGFAWMLVTGLVLVPSVVLFNRPKFLVAPPYRHEHGLLASRRRAREVARALGVRYGG